MPKFQPAYSGGTPTGSVIFENSSGAVIGTGPYTLNGKRNSKLCRRAPRKRILSVYFALFRRRQLPAHHWLWICLCRHRKRYPCNPDPERSSVPYGTTGLTATVTVTGTGVGGVPSGTATVYARPEPLRNGYADNRRRQYHRDRDVLCDGS